MSSQITHEIRNPLSSIGLNSELLEEELADNDEARALLSAIRAEIDRLTDVTEQYLRFARLPTPNLKAEDVNVILTDLLEFMGSEFSSASIKLSVDLELDLSAVDADEDQLRQAFLNLLRNSIESTEVGYFSLEQLETMDVMEAELLKVIDAFTGQEAAFVR